MSLDYSQKNLVNAPLARRTGRRARRLRQYAFFTGLMSTIVSLAGTIVIALKH